MPSENNCIIEDVDNEVNFLNPYDFNDSDSFDSSDDDDGNCVDTCENNSFNSNDNDGLESFTFDDNSLINEHVGELHDMLCNVDDELNVDASLLDLNDVEFDTFHDNCLDDAIYIHDLLGEEKEERDGDLRDVLLSSEKEEVEESVTIEKENEKENFENKKCRICPGCLPDPFLIHTGKQNQTTCRIDDVVEMWRRNRAAGWQWCEAGETSPSPTQQEPPTASRSINSSLAFPVLAGVKATCPVNSGHLLCLAWQLGVAVPSSARSSDGESPPVVRSLSPVSDENGTSVNIFFDTLMVEKVRMYAW
nr:hypothetical protein Iba_chr14cCG6450 [Ipomoea batatas]